MNCTSHIYDRDSKTLTISGDGCVGAEDINDIIREKVQNVIIENGVTGIGEGAFEDCFSLKNITIPDSVTSIGDGAFYNCDSLKEIHAPEHLIEQLQDKYPDITIVSNEPQKEEPTGLAGLKATVANTLSTLRKELFNIREDLQVEKIVPNELKERFGNISKQVDWSEKEETKQEPEAKTGLAALKENNKTEVFSTSQEDKEKEI